MQGIRTVILPLLLRASLLIFQYYVVMVAFAGVFCPGAVAQLGERLVRNEEVVGSTPISSTEVKSCATVRCSTPPGPEGSNGRYPKV